MKVLGAGRTPSYLYMCEGAGCMCYLYTCKVLGVGRMCYLYTCEGAGCGAHVLPVHV